MREETKAAVLNAGETSREAAYDAAVKATWKHKEIIAPLLQFVVPEFKGYSVEDVIRFIDADTISDDIAVEDVDPHLIDRGTESSSIREKLLFYDIRFDAKNPLLSDGRICVMMHIDFELQNDYRPSEKSSGGKVIEYPLVKRGIYYVSRMISQQLGRLTGVKDYNSLQKVYSIWLCMENIPADLKNTVTSYKFTKSDIIGVCEEPAADYDLAEIIMIRCGGEPEPGLFEYVESVFTANLQTLEKYSSLQDAPKIRKDVTHMGGFGHHLVVKGMELESANTDRERERADREQERADQEQMRADQAEATMREQRSLLEKKEEEIAMLREQLEELQKNS